MNIVGSSKLNWQIQIFWLKNKTKTIWLQHLHFFQRCLPRPHPSLHKLPLLPEMMACCCHHCHNCQLLRPAKERQQQPLQVQQQQPHLLDQSSPPGNGPSRPSCLHTVCTRSLRLWCTTLWKTCGRIPQLIDLASATCYMSWSPGIHHQHGRPSVHRVSQAGTT